MSNLVIVDVFGVTEKRGKPITSSRNVAEVFHRRHDNVLRDLVSLRDDVSRGFGALNFEDSYYRTEQNKRLPEVLMTKDGFTILAMGFTGKKAMRFKESYIQQFNQMESFIKSLAQAKMEFPAFTAAIMMAHEEPKHYHFSNEVNMINRIVLGMDTKQFKQVNGIDLKAPSIRPFLTLQQIKSIETLQRVDIGLQVSVSDFQERKRILTDYHQRSTLKAIAH